MPPIAPALIQLVTRLAPTQAAPATEAPPVDAPAEPAADPVTPAAEAAAGDAGADVSSGAGADVTSKLSEAGGELKSAAARALEGDPAALIELGMTYLVPAVTTLLVVFIAYFVAKLLARWASTPISRKVDPTVGSFVGKLVFYLIMAATLMGVWGRMGISVTGFAAVLGALSFAIGLAFQGTLSNFAAGLMLMIFRPFKVGDVVTTAGVTAKVAEIDLFTTQLDTIDNRRVIVPNSDIFGSTIENATFHKHRRVDVSVGTAYDADLDQTRAALTAAVETIGGRVNGEGRGFQILLNELGDSAIGWEVRVWFPTADYWTKREEIIRAVKNHLDNAGIGIPFPQREVWMHRAG